MKRLIIVDKSSVLNGGAAKPTDVSGMTNGSIGLYEVGSDAWLSAAPTKNFAIVAGRGANNQALIIPEVDMKTLKVTKAPYSAGTPLKKEITIATPADAMGKTINGQIYFVYTVIVTVAGTVPNERFNYTFSDMLPKSVNAKAVAANIGKRFSLQFAESGVNVDVTVANEKVTFAGKDADALFNVTVADSIANLAVITTDAVAASGTPKKILSLAKACAKDSGFEYPYESEDIYPGYPGTVDPAGTYDLYTLTYATPLHYTGRTSQETVNQVVHIAVPKGGVGSISAALDPVLTIA